MKKGKRYLECEKLVDKSKNYDAKEALELIKDLDREFALEPEIIKYDEVNYADKVALIIGSEGKGLSKIVRDNCDEIIEMIIGQILDNHYICGTQRGGLQ